MPDAKLEVKNLVLKASIDVETTPEDLQPWDAQEKILHNTGIERDGGITNLYRALESNTDYEETFYARNGSKVQLKRDSVNNLFRVFSDGSDVGQIPLWGVKSRRLVPRDANDVCITTEDTLLVLRISGAVATIEELDFSTLTILRQRTFSIPTSVVDGFFVRNKYPTWSTVTSIIGVYSSAGKLYHEVITDGGTVYTITGQLGFTLGAQVFGYYENGWIVSSNDPADSRTFLLKSDGTQDGTYTEAAFVVANYDESLNTVSFLGWRDVVTLGTPGTIGNVFTPPAAPLGSWTVTAKTATVTTPVDLVMTFGGYALAHTAGTHDLLFANNTPADRSWTIGHDTPPEIYGYLDNGASVAFKVHTAAGEGSYLSASFSEDGIGVPIVEPGELNAYYYPQILRWALGIIGADDSYRVAYRRGDNSFGVIELSYAASFSRIQEIAAGVVKLNTISAACVLDTATKDLQFGGNAYNGFVVVGYDATATTVQKAHVARHRGKYGGSVDTGYKSTAAILVGNVVLIDVPEWRSFTPSNDVIDVYSGTLPSSIEYFRSIRSGINQSTKINLQGTIYVDDSILPPPIGATYSVQTLLLIGTTAIREKNYDGYQLLNETTGAFESFSLYGNLYLFDGDAIYLAALTSGNVLSSVTRVSDALGLVFLCGSPTEIYFLSSFDNSLYSFSGGQSVDKILRLNQRTGILLGAYNVRENTLALFGSDFVLWLRDGILSESTLPFVYPYEIFSTGDGIWIVKDNYSIKYTYSAASGPSVVVIDLDLDGGIWGTAYADTYDGGTWGAVYDDTLSGEVWGSDVGGSVDELIWQSKFNGLSDRIRQSIDRFLFRVYKQDKAETTIAIEYQAYREAGILTENRSLTIPTTAYDANGYAVIEFIPANKNAVASSIKLTCPDKIVLLDGHVTISGLAGDTTARTRA